jgi:hypothetical protein
MLPTFGDFKSATSFKVSWAFVSITSVFLFAIWIASEERDSE